MPLPQQREEAWKWKLKVDAEKGRAESQVEKGHAESYVELSQESMMPIALRRSAGREVGSGHQKTSLPPLDLSKSVNCSGETAQ